ncbi:MAG: TIGR02302 family protein [Pseudomonadota bacterium]
MSQSPYPNYMRPREPDQNQNNSEQNNGFYQNRLNAKIYYSSLIIAFEQIWPRLWICAGIIGLFFLFSMMDLWSVLHPWAHRISFIIFVLAFFISLGFAFYIRWPTRLEAVRRLEKTANLPHRPLSSYADTLSSENKNQTTEALWNRHKQQLTQTFNKMRAGWPQPRVDKFDPFALRAALTLIIVITVVALGQTNIYNRLQSSIEFSSIISESSHRIDTWITPPLYTGKAPILLSDSNKPPNLTYTNSDENDKNAILVPENSMLVIRINSPHPQAFEIIKDLDGKQSILDPNDNPSDDKKSDDKRHDASVTPKDTSNQNVTTYKISLKQPVGVKIKQNAKTHHNWQFAIREDLPPTIKLTKPLATTKRGAVKLDYEIQDDYGVSSAQAHFNLPNKKPQANVSDTDPDRPLGTAPKFSLKLQKANAKITRSQMYKNLSSHPWAGLRVLLSLKAWDQAKQMGQSKPIEVTLPARKFYKPLAKALIEQKRFLTMRPKSNRIPVMRALNALTLAPEIFSKNKMVYLGLRSAYWRMNYNSDRKTIQSVVNQLWEIALLIEDGDLSDAEKNLRQAQQELADALQNKASDAEIKQLLNKLRQAVNRFLQALAKKNQNQTQPLISQNGQSPNNYVSPRDLDNILKNIENLAKSGARSMAQQMLSQLQNLLENLQASRPNQAGNARSMMSMMDDLGKLIARQQKLLDQTYDSQRNAEQNALGWQNQSQQGRNPRPGTGQQYRQGQQKGQNQGRSRGPGQGGKGEGGQASSLSQQQQALQKLLNNLMNKMRENGMQPSQQIGRAGQAMGDAGQALQGQNYDSATQEQTLALDQLRKGAQSLANQLMEQMGRRMGRSQTDPLGRTQRTAGPDFGTNVKVPDEIDIQRAREILRELRKRFNQPSRDAIELDYLERLLKRF